MNSIAEQEMCCHLLKLLSTKADFTQREMAAKMGISLGKVNYFISELIKKGLIKIKLNLVMEFRRRSCKECP